LADEKTRHKDGFSTASLGKNTHMHVFIDTNILLSFFHYSSDELDALNDVFASHEHGSATVHLTEQVIDEFHRNREVKIKDALKRFKDIKLSAQMPSFLKGYEEYGEIRQLSSEIQQKQKSILEKVNVDIFAKNLVADRLIKDIFDRPDVISTTQEVFSTASMRMAIGNPPGKNNSIGDAINWVLLLNSVPDGQNLHVISADGDFYSTLNEKQCHPFLNDEWHEKKGSTLYTYRTLSDFMKEHFDGIAFSFDNNKESLIDDLADTGSFAMTHSLIAKLEEYSYFSVKEVKKILSAAEENGQFGDIISDYDVSDFLNRIAVPHIGSLSEDSHKEMLQNVINEQRERPE